MEYLKNNSIDIEKLDSDIEIIVEKSKDLYIKENLMTIFSLIDLTTLNSTDTKPLVENMCDKVNNLNSTFPDIPNIAAICVYPSLVNTVRNKLDKNNNIKIASVAAGFPASQTFISIKMAEAKMAVAKGADEIDIVISLGTFLEKNYEEVFDEIRLIKEAIGEAHLKVILETGELTPDQINTASYLAMEAGADFIKTSTGKSNPAATLEAVYIMSSAIKDFHAKTGKKIGLKPAGGISTSTEAIKYFSVVKEVLGDEWLTPELFRIGASRLANDLLSEISYLNNNNPDEVSYF